MPYFSEHMRALITRPQYVRSLLEERYQQYQFEKYKLYQQIKKNEKRLERYQKDLAQKEAEKHALDITLALVRHPEVIKRLSINQSQLDYKTKELRFQLEKADANRMVILYKQLEELKHTLQNIEEGIAELNNMVEEAGPLHSRQPKE